MKKMIKEIIEFISKISIKMTDYYSIIAYLYDKI